MAFVPNRRVVTRSPHRRVGYVNCPWLQEESVEYESLLEQSFIRIALLCPGLVAIQHQPLKLDLPDGSRYTPDFLLTFHDCVQLVVEVKPSEYVPQHAEKLAAASLYLQAQGYQFLICTELEIDGGHHRDQASQDHRSNRAGRILRQAISTSAYANTAFVRNSIHRLKFPISIAELAETIGLEPCELMGVIGHGALRLRPDLSLDHIYSNSFFEGSGRGMPSHSAWLSAKNW